MNHEQHIIIMKIIIITLNLKCQAGTVANQRPEFKVTDAKLYSSRIFINSR